MIRSIPLKTGLVVTLTASMIAGGPALADALGLGVTAPAAHSAAWESSAARDAQNVAPSNEQAREAQAQREAEAKKERAAKKAREAERAREAKRQAEKERAARSRAQGGTPAQNRALGMQMCADEGWSNAQCADLDKLWQKESGWSTSAHNSSSGAHGIPQAMPGSKMASHGSDWSTSARTQVAWGLDYIKGSYGNPSNAWAHSQSHGWY